MRWSGRISVQDLEQALKVIKHAPPPEVVQGVVKKLDVDDDGYVVLEEILDLIGEEGLGASHSMHSLVNRLTCVITGVVVDAEAQDLLGQGRELLKSKAAKPRKEDIVQE
jgi:LETM1 and EF-hand domain-containing protein 1